MTRSALRVVALSAEHDRSTFASGSEPLDHYFRQRVTQDIRRRVTACLVAITPESRVAGYYTLASASLVLPRFLPKPPGGFPVTHRSPLFGWDAWPSIKPSVAKVSAAPYWPTLWRVPPVRRSQPLP